ncbi:MAG: hypothetical protein UY63_C0003G0003 [Parcubacteria group bacterium GW2011_GWA2_51_10]|nr:MAG: hypothetical protein UY63_C0003G0003 [Parcubacteria group bacterium GW2011_GWA2_51_10]
MNNIGSDISPKFIVVLVAFIAILVGVVWIARPQEDVLGAGEREQSETTQQDGSTGEASLVVEGDSNYDFGTISMAAGKVKREFKIKNTGEGPVTIEKMYTSCMCTEATLSAGGKRFGPFGMPGHAAVPTIRYTLSPNDEGIVEVVFDPAAHGPSGVGPIERAVRIENSGKPIELTFSAMVRP